MSMLQQLQDPLAWEEFYLRKQEGGHLGKRELQDLRAFIDGREYLPIAARILAGEDFPLPQKRQINKMHSDRKRIVYTFDREHNYVLKLLADLLHAYDDCFSEHLYSFRRDRGARRAIERLTSTQGIWECYAYKADIHDYFGSADPQKLLPALREVLQGEEPLLAFLQKLLENPWVLCEGTPIRERKGILAGVPISSFLANLYLREMDAFFEKQGLPYARYSDDILLFAPTERRLQEQVCQLHGYLQKYGLQINPKKEAYTMPGQPWSFLGFTCCEGRIDVSAATAAKLKGKLRRKARALDRWRRRTGVSAERAIRAYIRHFDRKLFENPVHNELTWCRWFFPVITVPDTLREIDRYMQQNIRFLVSGRHTKANYSLRYETMRQYGYKSLTGEFYRYKSGRNSRLRRSTTTDRQK